MDKQGNILTGRENEFLRSFSEKDEEEAPRKVTLSEYLSSPEVQRKRKMERKSVKSERLLSGKMAFPFSPGTEPDKRQAETETRSEGA